MEKRANWYELDNAAKIVPSTAKGANTRVFRLTCELTENVDEDILYPQSIDHPPEKSVKISFSIKGKNESNVIAREMYLSCDVLSTGSEYNKVRFLNYNQMDYIPNLDGNLNIITRPELRLPPLGSLKFTNVDIILSPLVDEDLRIDGVIGAAGAAPKNFRIYIPKNRLRSFVAKALREENTQILLTEFFNEYMVM